MSPIYKRLLSDLVRSCMIAAAFVLPSVAADKTAQSPAQVESPASATVPRPNQDKWAVVVGLSRFRDPLNKCQYGSQDAQDFTNYLVHDAHFAKDHVHTLIDTQATRDNVMRELGEVFLPQVTKPDDLVVVYFSTAGSEKGHDIGGINYLSSFDSDSKVLFASGIPMEGLAGMITQRMQSRHLLLIIDAPYSGSAVGGRPGLVRLNAESPGPSVTILTSTTADQTSWASVRCQNSVFTRQLIDSLRRTPQLSAAFPRVKDLVNEEVQSDHPGARQTPLLHSSGSEDLDLSVVPDAPQSGPKTESTEAPTKAKAKIETPGGTAAPR